MGKAQDQWIQFGMGAAEDVINTGLGLALEKHNDKRQLRQQEKLNDLMSKTSKSLTDYNYGKQMQMWRDTNYSAQMEEIKQAGLNPAMLYGMGGGGGTTTGSGSGSSAGGSAAPAGGGEVLGSRGMGIQRELATANLELIKSQARKNNAEADTTEGAGRANIQADTENKILAGVILKYTGKEQADTYNIVKQPNRSIEADTYQTELEARKGVAGNIYELWTEGKLKEKSVAEIEGLLLDNAKTRAEKAQIYTQMELIEQNIKGAKLDNIIRELETEIQTKTGVDRTSPTWMKVLARLFVTLTNK